MSNNGAIGVDFGSFDGRNDGESNSSGFVEMDNRSTQEDLFFGAIPFDSLYVPENTAYSAVQLKDKYLVHKSYLRPSDRMLPRMGLDAV